jgi:PTH1 family peptidyl-tRNA hydrolase
LRLIVGLGNPGKRYALARHNLGFWVVEQLAREHGFGPVKIWRNALIAEGQLGTKQVILAQPLTYMNRSGLAVTQLANFFKISFPHILVICDDLDLPTGAIRIRPQGGSGGHKGLASIISELGTEQFPRLRLGIGRPPIAEEVTNYVLKPFTREEKQEIEQAVANAVKAVVVFVEEGLDAAMNRYNKR